MVEDNSIRFLLNGQIVCVTTDDPHMSLLQYIREQAALCGTKEGCAEGDCGACTLVVGKIIDGEVKYRALNACILLLAQIHGCEVITVEGLQGEDGALHPVQQALVEFHGSQCGFCTPGFVMSLYAHYRNQLPNDRQSLKTALAGNLCRCTGYGPIIAAGQAMYGYPKPVEPDSLKILQTITGTPQQDERLFAPTTETDLQELLQKYPDAVLWAGGTDAGLWLSKNLQDISNIILLGSIPELDFVRDDESGLHIGATTRYADVIELCADKWPAMGEVMRRIGSTQIRNSGTIGGNIANGSPIGDMAPMLITMNARLNLASAEGIREILLESYFLEYGKQDLRPGEYIHSIFIPKPARDVIFHAWKISKRFDQDISAVLGAFSYERKKGRINNLRIAYGGMAAIPRRAFLAEQALEGTCADDTSIAQACQALIRDFTPLDDMRASAKYREQVAKALLNKAFQDNPVSLATDKYQYE